MFLLEARGTKRIALAPALNLTTLATAYLSEKRQDQSPKTSEPVRGLTISRHISHYICVRRMRGSIGQLIAIYYVGSLPCAKCRVQLPSRQIWDSRANEVGFSIRVAGGDIGGSVAMDWERTALSSCKSLFGRLVDAFAGSHRGLFLGVNRCGC